MKKKTVAKGQESNILAVVRIHFLYVAAYALAIIIFDSWNLIVPTAIKQRWMAAALLLAVTTITWVVLRMYRPSLGISKLLLFAVVLADIALAAMTVYGERGMTSPAVMMFAIPIITVAVLRSRVLTFATASLCTAAYAIAVVGYFVDHPSEGYKVQLYGMLTLYTAIFFVIAALLSFTNRSSSD